MSCATMGRRRELTRVVWVGVLVTIWAMGVGAHAQRSLETDRGALERFMVLVDAAGELLPWVRGTNPCTWTGIECEQGRVTALRVPGLHLAGALPTAALADLDELRVLSLHHNQFSGAFPAGLARCVRLQRLFLGHNRFSGPLPDFTGAWLALTHFSVGFNNLSGEIPASINGLGSLTVLDLHGNAFTGAIPTTMSLPSLLKFSVASNNLVGAVPGSLAKFPAWEFADNPGLCGPPTTKHLCTVAPVPSPFFMESGAPLVVTTAPAPKKLMSAGVTVVIAVSVVVVAILLIYILCRPQESTELLEKSHVGKPARDYSNEFNGHFKDSYTVTIASEPAPARSKLVFLRNQTEPQFALEDLLRASAETLGKGCMGTSYRADVGAAAVVVKRLKDVAADRDDFEQHIEAMGRLRHKNLVPLRAYYFSKDEKLIVSDYMPQGNLSNLLHGESRIHVDWVTREKIALGTARALAYLHKESVMQPHGSVKSSNVLLSRDLEPLLSDFALSRLLHSSSNHSYRAKEAMSDARKPTPEADVYSFGVLLLELLTRRAPRQLPKWVLSVARDKWMAEVLDVELLRYNDVEDEMVQMLQLALACADSMPDHRPKMDEVVLLLEDITGDDSSYRRPDAHVDPAKSRRSSGNYNAACAPILVPILVRPSSGVFVID